jgi:hypothetical protein
VLSAAVLFVAFAEAPLVIDDRPGFFFGNGSWDQGDHSRSGTAVLDDPEEFAVFPLLMEFAVREVAGARIEDRTGGTVPFPFFAMTIEAGALSFKQRLSLRDAFRCVRTGFFSALASAI